jgi:hypothetical protein
MGLGEIELESTEGIGLTEDRAQWRTLVSTVMILLAQYNAGKFMSSCTISGLSKRSQIHGFS